MTIQEYINKFVNELFDKYDDIAIFYEYKNNTETHFIKVLPKAIYDSIEFKEIYSDFVTGYLDNNFEGSICIISEDSAVSLNNPKVYINSSINTMNSFELNNLLQSNNFESLFVKNLVDISDNYCLAA